MDKTISYQGHYVLIEYYQKTIKKQKSKIDELNAKLEVSHNSILGL